jgi:peroxiredoxin
MPLLAPGDAFPDLTVTPAGDDAFQVPDALSGHFGVVLLLRGAWCPRCAAQLGAFQQAGESLASVDAKVVALSGDEAPATKALVDEHGIGFPVGHGADVREVAERTGAFVNASPLHLQPAGFVLDPGGRVLVSVYSSGPIGRLTPDDAVGLIRYAVAHRG